MPGFDHGREELRTKESVDRDRLQPLPGADGDSRSLDTPHCRLCGSYDWVYRGERIVCAGCGR